MGRGAGGGRADIELVESQNQRHQDFFLVGYVVLLHVCYRGSLGAQGDRVPSPRVDDDARVLVVFAVECHGCCAEGEPDGGLVGLAIDAWQVGKPLDLGRIRAGTLVQRDIMGQKGVVEGLWQGSRRLAKGRGPVVVADGGHGLGHLVGVLGLGGEDGVVDHGMERRNRLV